MQSDAALGSRSAGREKSQWAEEARVSGCPGSERQQTSSLLGVGVLAWANAAFVCPQETRADVNDAELGQARLPLGVLPLCLSLGDISLVFRRKVVTLQWKGCSACQTYKKKRKHKLGNVTRDSFKWSQCWVCVFLDCEKPKTSSLEIAFKIL